MAAENGDDKVSELGTVSSANRLLTDLYVELRKKTTAWALITRQTAQARMGYIGQHLVSVVSGYPGGRSGARGRDLWIDGDNHAEIKTCYRIDQLGKCIDCNGPVASVELECENCQSTNIKRNDDSKWLLLFKDEAELQDIFSSRWIYLVLFDFEDISRPTTVNARIWRVDPTVKGFSYCMIDYYFNIKAKSSSGAPFNLWPYSLKFEVMKAELIYHSQILADDSILTIIHPQEPDLEKRSSILNGPQPLDEYSRSTNLTYECIEHVADAFKVDLGNPRPAKRRALQLLEERRLAEGWDDAFLSDVIAEGLYLDRITNYLDRIPDER